MSIKKDRFPQRGIYNLPEPPLQALAAALNAKEGFAGLWKYVFAFKCKKNLAK
jgi:hypothetical protein